MRRIYPFLVCFLLIVLLSPVFAVESATPTATDRIPPLAPGTSVTTQAVYKLNYLMGRGMSLPEMAKRSGQVSRIRTAQDLVSACQELGYRAEIWNQETVKILQVKGPFLVKNDAGDWYLHEVRDGKIIRYEGLEVERNLRAVDLIRNGLGGEAVIVSLEQFEPGKEPQIKFEEITHDFGKIVQGEKVTHLFPFEDVGQGVLEILSVTGSCGCTAAVVENNKNRYGPGEKGNIKVTLDTANKSRAVSQAIRVRTNDPKQPTVSLEIKAEVQVPLKISPPSVWLGRIRKNAVVSKDVTLTSDLKSDFKILDVQCSSPCVRFATQVFEELKLTGGPNPVHTGETARGYRLTLEFDVSGMNYDDQVSGNVVVKTDVEGRREVGIPVSGTVSGDLYMSPKTINFGYLSPNTTVNRVMLIRNENPSFDLKIGKIECASAEVEFATKATSEGKSYVINVTLKTGPEPVPVDTDFVIHTNHPDQPALTAKIRAMVGPPGRATTGSPARTRNDVDAIIRDRSRQ